MTGQYVIRQIFEAAVFMTGAPACLLDPVRYVDLIVNCKQSVRQLGYLTVLTLRNHLLASPPIHVEQG